MTLSQVGVGCTLMTFLRQGLYSVTAYIYESLTFGDGSKVLKIYLSLKFVY